MLIGPVFNREVAIAPRRTRTYVARTAYAIMLAVLMGAIYLLAFGLGFRVSAVDKLEHKSFLEGR